MSRNGIHAEYSACAPWRRRGRGREWSLDRAEKLFTVADAVHNLVPARVGHGKGQSLGQHPARDLIGAVADRLRRRASWMGGRYAYQSPERIASLRITQPEIPAGHRGALR